MVRGWRLAGPAIVLLACAALANAQAPDKSRDTAPDSEKEIERYRAMISDPFSNPGFLNVDRGEALWKLRRGAKNVSLEACDVGEGPGKTPVSEIVVHSEKGSPVYAHLLAQLVLPDFPIPMGVLYRHDKPTYDTLATAQVEEAKAKLGLGDLNKLMFAGMTWEVGADGIRH